MRESRRATLRRILALSLALSLTTAVSAPGLAIAAPPGTAGTAEIEVLALASNDAVDEASALTDAIRRAVSSAPHISDNGKARALEAVSLTANCDDAMAPACGPKLAIELKGERFVYGTLKKVGGKLSATLAYFDSGKLKTAAKTYDIGPLAKDGAAPELKSIAQEMLYQLLGVPKSKVTVTVAGPGASSSGDLFEGPTKVGRIEAGHGTFELPFGKHSLEYRAEGYMNTLTSVDLTSTSYSLSLTPTANTSSSGDIQLYSGIAAMGVGAILIGIGISTSASIKSSQDDDRFTSYRKRWSPSEGDTCAQAKAGKESPKGGTPFGEPLAPYVADLCNSVSSKLVTQYVYYGLGGAFIAGGVTLVMLRSGGSTKDTPRKGAATDRGFALKVAPSVSPDFGGLSFTGSF